MPTYTFRNKKTGKTREEFMSISEADAYEKANPHIERMCGAPGIADPWRLGRIKPDGGFRDLLRAVRKKHRGSNINTFD